MTGYVYAARSCETGLIKIGFSRNPHRRARELKCRLLCYARGTPSHEKEVHRLLHAWRVDGEWFREEGRVAWFLAMLPPAKDPPVACAKGSFGHLIQALGGPSVFAARMNLRRITAQKMQDRNSIAPRHWRALIQVASEQGISLNEDTLLRMATAGVPS
jgi:hypothetical protein